MVAGGAEAAEEPKGNCGRGAEGDRNEAVGHRHLAVA